MKKRKSKKKIIAGVILILVILLVVGFFLKGRSAQAATTTKTSTAQTMTIEKTLSSDGEITSALEENKTPHTSYYLKKIRVSEGDKVKKGATILTYTNGKKMTAPYDCVVESWYLPDSGDQLTSDHYVTIAGTDVMQIELSVSEDEVSLLEEGDSATVTVEAINKTYTGEVSYVSQVGEYSNGSSTFTARVAFDNDGKLKLGMTGSAEISLDKAENVVAVPKDAVHVSGNSSYVTIQKDDSTEEVQVETGLSNDSYIEIESGLEAGTSVVVPQSDDSDSSNGGFGGGMGGMGGMGGSGGMSGGSGHSGRSGSGAPSGPPSQ